MSSIANYISELRLSLIILFVLAALIILVVASMMRRKTHRGSVPRTIHLPLVALLLTVSSLFWTTDVAYDRESLQHLEFGWPLPFVLQNREMLDPPFPQAMHFGWTSAYHQLLVGRALASLGLNFVLVLIAWYLYLFLRKTRG